MKRVTNFFRISMSGLFLFILCSGSLSAMPRLYLEMEDLLLLKIIVMLIGILAGWFISRIIYPFLLEKGTDPFKARNIFNATAFAVIVLAYGISFHTTVNILFFSIALGIISIVWMGVAIIKN